MEAKTKQPSMSLYFAPDHEADLTRYFTRGKLDYPNNETTRASRKYVRAMKQLTVCFFRTLLGCFANNCRNSFRPILPSTGCSWTSCNESLFTIPSSVSRPSKLCSIPGSKRPLSTMVPKLSGSVNNCSVGVGSRLGCSTDPPRVC